MFRFTAIVLFLAFSIPVSAQEARLQRANICDQNTSSCRELALEVAKANVRDRIAEARILTGQGNLLCPDDNLNCCPPHLMPMCGKFLSDIVEDVQIQLLQNSKSKKCPFTQGICDMLSDKYCDSIEETYTPWSGCTKIGGGVVGPSCPFGTVADPFGNCQPWSPCQIGFKHNSKGICIPEPCYHEGTGIPTPCNFYPGNAGVLASTSSSSDTRAPSRFLVENLSDQSLQLEAAKLVLEDLKASISLAEEQVNLLAK